MLQSSIPFINMLEESLSKQGSRYKCLFVHDINVCFWCFCFNEHMKFQKAFYKSICSWVQSITFKLVNVSISCKVSFLQRTVHIDGISSEFWTFLAPFLPLSSFSKSFVLFGHNGVNDVNKLTQKTQARSGVQIWVCLVYTELFQNVN